VSRLKFLPVDHAIYKVEPALLERLVDAQSNRFGFEFASVDHVIDRVTSDCKLRLSPSKTRIKDDPEDFADRGFSDLSSFYFDLLSQSNFPVQVARRHAEALAARTHLLRAFENPDDAIEYVRNKVSEIVAAFPRTGRDMEVGKNKGDVLDPFILAATQHLLHKGSFEGAVESTVAHKGLMMIEGLMGHLHEEVIGMMRGSVRIQEPRGDDQETFHSIKNPFPGADIVQPPYRAGDRLSIHQVKAKTGSAKGGDGKRLGEQLRFLATRYDADIYYHALVGNTLSGHRSKTGVEKAAPNVIVLVGESAFHTLTHSKIGPQLLLRLYQEAFQAVAQSNPYSIREIAKVISTFFSNEAKSHGGTYLEIVLSRATGGAPSQQDSREFNKTRRPR
jgi:hypothetical protein